MAIAKKPAPAVNLQEQLAGKRTELIETKRSHAAGELVNPRALGRIRKDIARLHTQLNAPEAGPKELTEEEKK